MELVRSGASIHILDISRPQRISRGRLCCDVPDVLYDADRPGALIGAAAPCLRSNPREGKKNSLSVAAEPKIASPSTQDPYRQPTYSLANRVGRQLWNICYVLLFRTSPTPFFAWRAWLLRLFGAKLGPTCRFYPRCRVWAPWNLICEDVVAVGLTWLTTQHPWIAAAIAATLILVAILAARSIVRLLRRLWHQPSAHPAT